MIGLQISLLIGLCSLLVIASLICIAIVAVCWMNSITRNPDSTDSLRLVGLFAIASFELISLASIAVLLKYVFIG